MEKPVPHVDAFLIYFIGFDFIGIVPMVLITATPQTRAQAPSLTGLWRKRSRNARRGEAEW
jgi:hypothetical protein